MMLHDDGFDGGKRSRKATRGKTTAAARAQELVAVVHGCTDTDQEFVKRFTRQAHGRSDVTITVMMAADHISAIW